MTAHVLLVDPVPDEPVEALAVVPGLAVTPVTTLAAARAYLAGSAFDAVAVRTGADPDGSIEALAAGLGLTSRVVAYDDAVVLRSVLAAHFGIRPATDLPAAAASESGGLDVEALRAALGRVAHDLANPLAVIAGNAQLGAEIARATGADVSLIQAFVDIEEAAAELDRRIGGLAALRARLGGRG
ncbi:MAG TPA: hypothetical protein VF594_02755 [Rubricoccaceae bacterium]|jgi:signal transduction histidine kinase